MCGCVCLTRADDTISLTWFEVMQFIWLIFTASIPTASAIQSGVGESNAFHFFCLADWGKGGINGDIRTQSTYDFNDYTASDDDDGKDFNSTHSIHANISTHGDPGGGGGGKGNNRNKNTYTYQLMMAEAMGSYAESVVAPSVIFALGDNFYNDGVTSAYDEMWDTHWTQVYLDTSEKLKVPWYSALGNHVHK